MGYGTSFALVYGYSIRTPTLLQAAKIWEEGKAGYLSMGIAIARHSQGKLHCEGKKTSLASLPIELLLRIRDAVLTSDEKWQEGPCFCCNPGAMAEVFGEEDGEEPEEPMHLPEEHSTCPDCREGDMIHRQGQHSGDEGRKIQRLLVDHGLQHALQTLPGSLLDLGHHIIGLPLHSLAKLKGNPKSLAHASGAPKLALSVHDRSAQFCSIIDPNSLSVSSKQTSHLTDFLDKFQLEIDHGSLSGTLLSSSMDKKEVKQRVKELMQSKQPQWMLAAVQNETDLV